MTKPLLHIIHVYPDEMNIYGDHGNLLVLKHRALAHGLKPVVTNYRPGGVWPKSADLVLGGGGQDAGQIIVAKDLQRIAKPLIQAAHAGTPMLFVCGMYQLMGHEFITLDGTRIPGIGLLDITTRGTDTRLIGNVIASSDLFGDLVGYENHSGQTTLGPQVEPFARVIKGAGNSEAAGFEGARIHNVIGTYLHGALLPKNPVLADWLIATAMQRRLPAFKLQPIDDSLAEKARAQAMKRPR